MTLYTDTVQCQCNWSRISAVKKPWVLMILFKIPFPIGGNYKFTFIQVLLLCFILNVILENKLFFKILKCLEVAWLFLCLKINRKVCKKVEFLKLKLLARYIAWNGFKYRYICLNNRVLKKFRKGCIYLITLKKDYAKFYRRYKKSKCDIAFPRDLL